MSKLTTQATVDMFNAMSEEEKLLCLSTVSTTILLNEVNRRVLSMEDSLHSVSKIVAAVEEVNLVPHTEKCVENKDGSCSKDLKEMVIPWK